MSALSATEAPVLTGTVVPAAANTAERRQHSGLRLVSPPTAGPMQAGVRGVAQPCACSIGQRQSRGTAGRTRVRLTRRGRIVLTAVTVVCIALAVMAASLLASGGAQASNHGQVGGAYQGMHQIVVQPGQTLWSIASVAEPSVDPRAVVQQIMSVNTLSGTNIQAGQLLWVPRPGG